MQFRFRKYDEEKQHYDLITYIDVKNYSEMFKTLTYMKEHECSDSIEINTESMVETIGDSYEVIAVSLCVDEDPGEEGLTPHFVVDIKEC